MKKLSTIVLSLLMVLTMIFGLTGCGEEITLVSQAANGLSVDVPSDFSEFAETQGVMGATNEDASASIAINPAGDAQGTVPTDWDEDSYTQVMIPNYSDVTFLEFDTEATAAGVPALYAHFTATNSKGIQLESYNFVLYLDDGTLQSITFSYSVDADSSLEANIDAVISSINFA